MSSHKFFKSSYNRSGLSSVTNSGVASRCDRPVGEGFGPNQWSDSPAPEMVENICSVVSADQTLGVDDSNRVIVKRHGFWCRFKSLVSCNRKSDKNRVETNDSIGIRTEEESNPSVSYRIDIQNRVLSGEESLLNGQNMRETQTDHSSDPLVLQLNNNRVDTKPKPDLMIEALVPQISASGPEVVDVNQTFTAEEAIEVSEHKRHGFYCRLNTWFRHRFRYDVKNIIEIEENSDSIHSEYLTLIRSESDPNLIEDNEDNNQIVSRVEINSGLNPVINELESEIRSTADNSCPVTEPQISANNKHISVESNEQHISIGDNNLNTKVDEHIPEVCIVENPKESEFIPNQKRVRFHSKPKIVYIKDSKSRSDSSTKFKPKLEVISELDELTADPEDRRQELEAIPELDEPKDPEIDPKNKLEFLEIDSDLMKEILSKPKISGQNKREYKELFTTFKGCRYSSDSTYLYRRYGNCFWGSYGDTKCCPKVQ